MDPGADGATPEEQREAENEIKSHLSFSASKVAAQWRRNHRGSEHNWVSRVSDNFIEDHRHKR
jgi:hypothetical protein